MALRVPVPSGGNANELIMLDTAGRCIVNVTSAGSAFNVAVANNNCSFNGAITISIGGNNFKIPLVTG